MDYFLYHSIGMFPGKAERVSEALARVAGIWGTADDAQWPQSLAIRSRFLERWRTLLRAPAGSLTTADSVTSALYSLVGALPDARLRGRQVLIAADCFPSLHFLLAGMAERRGFELVTVPVRPGENWVRDEDFIAQWSADVGLALLTWVTSTSSHRCNLGSLVKHARARGSLVGVDLTQGVGIIPLDAAANEADFLVASSLKWLCGVSGAAILQVRAELLRECRPEFRGWFSQEDPFSWNLDAFEYARDARRFDQGTPSILPFAACLPALEWHAQQDPVALLAHNRRLLEVLVDAGAALDLELVSPRRSDERGGSMMFRLPGGADPAPVVAALREKQIYTDCRGAVLRLSPGNVTSDDGASRLLKALHGLLR